MVDMAGGADVVVERARRLAEQVDMELECHQADWAQANSSKGGNRPPRSWFLETERVLAGGRLRVKGRLPRSTNNALLVEVEGVDRMLAVYKPSRLARPLWDFDRDSLHKRELAAYIVSVELGWMLVPPTVVRRGPCGEGAVQLYVPPARAGSYFELIGDDAYRDELMKVCLFDLVVNNADRKAGHCIVDARSSLWSVDHGTCFHTDEKLRTVIWEFGGEQVPGHLLDDVRRMASRLESPGAGDPSPLSRKLASLLDQQEVDAMVERIERVCSSGRFPDPGPVPSMPWPLV